MSEIVRIRRSVTTRGISAPPRSPEAPRNSATLRLALAASGRRGTTSVADLVLRGAWQLVGGYVWLVLFFKGPEPARPGARFGPRRR